MAHGSVIQYGYALDEKGKPVHINDVPINYAERGKYYSLDGGDEMIARKGKVIAWHFAHKDGRPGALETYLHVLGKTAFKEAFEDSDQFTISLDTPHPCSRIDMCPIRDKEHCSPRKPYPFDLKAYYSHCELEKRISINGKEYVADVCLIPRNPKNGFLCIEIQNTHASTTSKLHSGLRIIEIQVDKENDVKIFQQHNLHETGKIHFYGFQQPRLPSGVTTVRVRAHSLKQLRIHLDGRISENSDYCDIFASDGGWNTKDTSFMIVMVDTSNLEHLDFREFGLQKARDWGCELPTALNSTTSNKYRSMVLRPYTVYYIWIPAFPNGPKLIDEQREGDALIDKMESMLASGTHGLSKQEEEYWLRVRELKYQGDNDFDYDAFCCALYEAGQRGMYVKLVRRPMWSADVDAYWANSPYRHVPALVEQLPGEVFDY